MSNLMMGLLDGRYAVKPKPQEPAGVTLDSAQRQQISLDAAGDFTEQYLATQAAAVVNEWAGTVELEDGENIADRLLAMLVGTVDDDIDGELTDDEQEAVGLALNAAADYLVSLGVSEADAEGLLSNWDEATAIRVRELVAANLPDGADAEDAALDSFVFDADALETTMDAAYRKTVVVRKGRKVRINKRIAGHVRLSAAQKVAIKKARRKAFTAKAMARRAKSMRVRRQMNL